MSRHALRTAGRLASLAAFLAVTTAIPLRAQEIPSADEQRSRRLGFYFGISLERASQRGMATGIGIEVDAPPLPGAEVPIIGPGIDGDFSGRFNIGFTLGFRLRNHGNIEASFFQWDELEDLRLAAPDGKAIANTLASPDAGFFEDQGNPFVAGSVDGRVDGVEAEALSEGSEQADAVLDGAEDLNFNNTADFIRFATSDEIVGTLQTDYQKFDLDYRRTLKRFRRFQLDGRVGLRLASLGQETDLAYRDVDHFAVYLDDEGCSDCSERSGTVTSDIIDGDGDGELSATENEPDGDGFLDGNENGQLFDRIESVETVSEDRILASIDTEGVGLKLGVDGAFDLTDKWTLRGGFAVSLLSTDAEFRYRETFVSERDRYQNFFNWDLNGDGVFDNRDLDFDGDCPDPPNPCTPDIGDNSWVRNQGGSVSLQQRRGAQNSVVADPAGLPTTNAFDPAFGTAGLIRVGDPIPESERNTETVRETSLLHDVSGSSSDLTTQLDLHLEAEYKFSRFASVSFGLRSSRWFDAGRFRDLASSVVTTGSASIDGDFALDGYYVMITVVPR